MSQSIYPLGHGVVEAERLETQANLLSCPELERLASEARTILEIGCGTGANLRHLQDLYQRLECTGIDSAVEAIALARKRSSSGTGYEVMDAAQLEFPEASFDLVFTKLVLWSVGPGWDKVISEAFRVLKPGGIFLAFEPDDHLVTFSPALPALEAFIGTWDQLAIERGLDPYVGRKVAGVLIKEGFVDVTAELHSEIALGSQRTKFLTIRENLRHFYLGASAARLGIDSSSPLRQAAERDLRGFSPDSLVMDGFFVAKGSKPVGGEPLDSRHKS